MSNDAEKRKVGMVIVSGLLLIVIGTAVTIGVTSNPSKQVTSSMKAIEDVCAPTDYKEACVKSYEESGTDSSDPKELIQVGFNSTMKHILEAAEKSETLKELEEDPEAKQALDICRRMMEYSMDELEASFERLAKIDIMKVDDVVEDLNIWLSSVSTFQDTCLDGFENVTSKAGDKMKKVLNMSMELTSNALAMITEITSIIGNLSIPDLHTSSNDHRRRLLQTENAVPLEPDTEMADLVGSGRRNKLMEGSNRPREVPLELDTEVRDWPVGPTKRNLLAGSNKPHEVPLEPDTEVLDWVGPTKRNLLAGSNKRHEVPLEPDTEVPNSVGPMKRNLLAGSNKQHEVPLEPDAVEPDWVGPTERKLLEGSNKPHEVPLEPDAVEPDWVGPTKRKLLVGSNKPHEVPLKPDAVEPDWVGPTKRKLLVGSNKPHEVPLEPDAVEPDWVGPTNRKLLEGSNKPHEVPLEPDAVEPDWVGPTKRKLLEGSNKPHEVPLEPDAVEPDWVGLTKRKLLENSNKPHDVPLEPDTKVPDWVGPTKRKLLAGSNIKPDLVVAKDGSGKYKTINAALKDIPLESTKPFVLHVKAGVYKEKVTFDKKISNLILIGDGQTKSKITNNKNYAAGVKTWDTATVTVLGNEFFARDIGFENTAGAAGHQAVALLVKSEKSVVYNCQMDGYQDTLYVPALRQFYRDCVISGTIDFIFGNAAAIFQNCKILIRKPMANQQCIVTAQGRKESRARTGIVLQGCTITGDETYMAVKDEFKSYLGRPWKKFSRTIIMESHIDGIIEPEGWLPWAGNFALNTLYYSEFNNKGPGANKAHRVVWKGIRQLSLAQAMSYTPKRFFYDDDWITAREIPYKPGMLA